MKDKTRISRWQQLCLVFLCLLSPIIRTLPRQTALFAGHLAWISAVLSFIPLALVFLLLRRFFKNAGEEEGLAELFMRALGKPAGKAAILLFTIWTLLYAALTLRSGADRYISSAYQHSSPGFFVAVLLLLGLLAALGSLRSFSRTAEVFLPIVAIVLALFIFISFRSINPHFLPPPALSQTVDILSGVPSVSAVLGTSVIYFGFLEGRIRKREKLSRNHFVFLPAVVVVVALLCVTTIGVFGSKLVSRMSFPFFILVSNLTLFDGIGRLESFIIALWVIMDFILVATLLFISASNLKICFGYKPESGEASRMLDLKNGRWTIWLSAALTLTLALLIAPNSFTLSRISSVVAPIVNLCAVFGFLPLIIITGVIRRRV